jgi:hypothetical protein
MNCPLRARTAHLREPPGANFNAGYPVRGVMSTFGAASRQPSLLGETIFSTFWSINIQGARESREQFLGPNLYLCISSTSNLFASL